MDVLLAIIMLVLAGLCIWFAWLVEWHKQEHEAAAYRADREAESRQWLTGELERALEDAEARGAHAIRASWLRGMLVQAKSMRRIP